MSDRDQPSQWADSSATAHTSASVPKNQTALPLPQLRKQILRLARLNLGHSTGIVMLLRWWRLQCGQGEPSSVFNHGSRQS